MFEELISQSWFTPLTCTARLALVGDLDMASVAKAEAGLDDALAYHPRQLDIDLSRLAFCDSSGLHFLIDVTRRMKERGIELRLLDPSPGVARLFALVGAEERLPVLREDAAEEDRGLAVDGG